MKRWAIITAALYALALLFLTVPTLLLFSIEFAKADRTWTLNSSLEEASQIFSHWGYWLWFIILVTAQALLLLVPVNIAERRLPARRKLLLPVATASFLLGNLLFAGFFCVLSAFLGDDASAVVEGPASLAEQVANNFPPARALFEGIGITAGEEFFGIMTALGMMVTLWLIWALIFFHYAQADTPEGIVRRATSWLLRSSILELLVAVPSHIVVRSRDDCCAPFATFWGIVTGISVMLLSFGPGVFFLFARRMKQIRPPATKPRTDPPSRL